MPSEPEACVAQLAAFRELHQSADALLGAIYAGKAAWSARQTARQEKLRAAYAVAKSDPEAMMAWQRLIQLVGHDSPLLSIEPVVPRLGAQPGNAFLDATLQLALRYAEWRHPPEAWLPTEEEPRAQFGSLARHLFARYAVPSFFDDAWFEGFTPEGAQHRDWFLHIGGGQNLRRAQLPLRLTEKAAHYALQAPADYGIVGALRYGQILGLGGDAYLAQAVVESKLGELLPDEPFWFTVLHFFVNNPQISAQTVAPLVDYLYYQKFGEQHSLTAATALIPGAPEPDFSMKGRTLPALQKRMEAWHEALAREAKRPRSSWEPCGIAPLLLEERDCFGTLNAWAIVELCDSHALREEGREMKHCVFTYAAGCLNGTTAIYSLRVKSAGEGRFRRLLTIEVNLTKRAIVQVRGRCNLTLGNLTRKGRMQIAAQMLRRWAQERRLSIACRH